MADTRRRTQKLGKVAALAAAEERRFGVEAGRSQRHLNEQLERLGELNAFRHNYARKNSGMARVTSAHLKDYQNFLSRLDVAVRAQQQIVRDCEQNLATHRKRWMIKRQKLESLERVLEKYQVQDHAQREKLEQKLLDDLPNAGIQGFERDDS